VYRIDPQPYGFGLTFSGSVPKEEMAQWMQESLAALKEARTGFGVVVDMRTLKVLSPEAKVVMEAGQKLYKSSGMARSAVILDSVLLTMQFKSIAKETGIHQWERYINASAHPDWEQLALDWIQRGLDPDRVGTPTV